ncbi:MAG: KTSC domain-containing protein, partial [Clostridia bacterium]|nr:KTSC domain-containing protein [Clostridia bacterium]
KNTIFFPKNNKMILFRDYNEEKKLDRVWFDSSNVVYSECDDNVDDLKTLRVVFKTGDLYQYKDVDVKDYLMFIAGGTQGSNGKAFYKFIRAKGYNFAAPSKSRRRAKFRRGERAEVSGGRSEVS